MFWVVICAKLNTIMYLAIDVGGTKTLIGLFAENGSIHNSCRFETPKEYKIFLKELRYNIDKLTTKNEVLRGCCIAIPGLIDRHSGIIQALGNLPWKNVPIKKDLSEMVKDIPIFIENDARLAGLAEASIVRFSYQRVLYLTISTGIGGALVINGKISKDLEDTEVGKMPLMHNGRLRPWEEFASGRWIVKNFGKKASEIDDSKTWKQIGTNIGYGVEALCAVLQPQAIIFGGGVGQYSDKFADHVSGHLLKNLHAVVKQPQALLHARYPDDAVLHGCYRYIKQKLNT